MYSMEKCLLLTFVCVLACVSTQACFAGDYQEYKSLKGVDPAEFGAVVMLYEVPEEELALLRGCAAIEDLDLTGMTLSKAESFDILAGLPACHSLGFSCCRIENWTHLTRLADAGALRRLGVCWTGVDDTACAAIGALKQVTHLRINDDYVLNPPALTSKGYESLAALPKLTEFVFPPDIDPVAAHVRAFKASKTLERLICPSMSADHDFVRAVCEIKTLRYLTISIGRCEDLECTASLSQLEELDITGSPSGLVLQKKAGLLRVGSPTMRRMWLTNVNVEGGQLFADTCRFPNLKQLLISSWGVVAPASWNQLATYCELECIQLVGEKLNSAEAVAALAKLPKLKDVNLCEVNLKLEELKPLLWITNLEKLVLNRVKNLSDEDADTLSRKLHDLRPDAKETWFWIGRD